MLNSMTAFARQDATVETGTLTWELRSVNHRYLEPTFRIPDQFREIEGKLREILRASISRGKVDCSLKWQANEQTSNTLKLNTKAITELNNALNVVGSLVDKTEKPDALSILAWPGVVESSQTDTKQVLVSAMDSFKGAVTTLAENRAREGQQLAPLFDERLSSITQIVAEVRTRMPQILAQQHDNLVKKIEDAKVEVDSQRLEQELIMLAQKSDVAEELDRLEAHVVEVSAVLKKQEPVGRRLDFLMQELNREANTLSSKSIVTDTTKAAVDLKVLIEQMREQVQNIE